MNWGQFKDEIWKNPFLMAGVVMVVLGLVSANAMWIWMGVLVILVILLMESGKGENEKEGD